MKQRAKSSLSPKTLLSNTVEALPAEKTAISFAQATVTKSSLLKANFENIHVIRIHQN